MGEELKNNRKDKLKGKKMSNREPLILPKVGNRISTFNQTFGQGFMSTQFDNSSSNRFKKFALPKPAEAQEFKLPNIGAKYKVHKNAKSPVRRPARRPLGALNV